MPTPIDEQHTYNDLCLTEKNLKAEYDRIRDSGLASQRVIAEAYGRFAAAIQRRAVYTKHFPNVRDSAPSVAPVQTQNFDPSNVNASTPWMPL